MAATSSCDDPAVAARKSEELLAALGEREPETVDHLRRVAAIAKAVASDLGWPEDQVRWATYGALLHDIGKMRIPQGLTYKPGPLTQIEETAMRAHVDHGVRLVAAFGFPETVIRVVAEHHERLDGSGYPHGLVGDRICREARLVMLADIADAMLSRRPYKEPMSLEDVRLAFEVGRGTLFDADLIDPVLKRLQACAGEKDAGPTLT
ncbi:HD-GYP domain-containing protein [Amorphus sp. 3PC139-8]|uniref:HD-GYP domain-containing protein n=1 Tax=Amorphus sp. 3PC139-8 TaxID=2735676 RepID=UPI00345C84A8